MATLVIPAKAGIQLRRRSRDYDDEASYPRPDPPPSALRAGDRRFLCLRPRRLSHPRQPQGPAGRAGGASSRPGRWPRSPPSSLLYVAVTALSLPGAAILTLAAGAIFGLWRGTLIVSFASTIGASLAFLSSRYLLRDWVKARFGNRIAAIDRGIARDGAFYLLTLRLIPAFPFFLVNLAMGLTAMRLLTFALVSQAGMLLGTLVYVNAGTQLAAIESTRDILSPALIGSFVLLGLFPLFAKALVGWWKRRRVYRRWRRPRRFDRNLIVIGAGAGGLVTALIGATVRAKVTLIEKGEMGGDCLNTGCVPSKALIRSARAAHEIRTAAAYGIAPAEPEVRFQAVIERIHRIIAEIAPADSVERYTEPGRRRAQGPCDSWSIRGRSRSTAASG